MCVFCFRLEKIDRGSPNNHYASWITLVLKLHVGLVMKWSWHTLFKLLSTLECRRVVYCSRQHLYSFLLCTSVDRGSTNNHSLREDYIGFKAVLMKWFCWHILFNLSTFEYRPVAYCSRQHLLYIRCLYVLNIV